MRLPSLKRWCVCLLARLFWRDPMPVSPESRESKPQPPRKPLMLYWMGEIDEPDVAAIMRLSWFERGRVRHVEEFRVYDSPDALHVVCTALQQATKQHLDLTILSEHHPEVFGIVCESNEV